MVSLTSEVTAQNSFGESVKSVVAKMPAVTSTTSEQQNDADQKMWNALKRYIIRERQRKKEGVCFIF